MKWQKYFLNHNTSNTDKYKMIKASDTNMMDLLSSNLWLVHQNSIYERGEFIKERERDEQI